MTNLQPPDLRNSLSEAEVDTHIASLGRLSEKAMKDGDPAGARIWSTRMYAAIKGRSPEHKARLEREALERLDSMTFAGDWTQEVLARSGAYFDVPAAAVRRRAAC